MSSVLYRLGRFVTRRPRLVLAGWALLLTLLAGAAATFQHGTDDAIRIPGAESSDALDHLRQVFPELAGAGVVLVVEQPPGRSVDTPAIRAGLAEAVRSLTALQHVVYTAGPFDPGTRGQVSPDRRLAVVTAFLDVDALHVTAPVKTSLEHVAARLGDRLGDPATGAARVHLGGDALGTSVPQVTPTEGLGLVVALLVLALMLRSPGAALLPLLMALLGVATTMSGIYLATSFTQIVSSAPVLALMIGLAVGIDYALFVLARARSQLAEGDLDFAECIARATATAGSAVVVAGVTVVVALVGLFVAGIPFLTATGLAAGFGVAVAVAVSLTALPAVMVLAGPRLRPRRRSRPGPGRAGPALATRWVRGVTARPLLTALLVTGALALCAVPAKDLRLSIPDGSALERGDPARVTYELLASHFGAGYNAPLLLVIDVLPSEDPVGVTNQIAREVSAVPGVASVPVATPNRTGDTAIVEVIPATAADDPATARLTERLHDLEPVLQREHGLRVKITGLTAVTIDLSARLGRALVPFGLFVIGLSVLLLATAFRSLAMPLSAAAGYLLSVGAAFGVTASVWTHGVLAGFLRVQHVGSVMAFVPILLMGVLFGLAMDYQMFLVSRMREHYVEHGDARAAVVEGFAASAGVVTTAAVIMLAVFAFFVPDGTADTKPIAFSLAVGVLIDAFAVRMTLVPAVLTLLGDRAWTLPGWAGRRLPNLDPEGQGLARELRLLGDGSGDPDGSAGAPVPVVAAHGLSVHDDAGEAVICGLSGSLEPGEALVAVGPSASALLLAFAGRVTTLTGDLVVCGQVLPGRRRAVRRTVALVTPGDPDPVQAMESALRTAAPLLLLDGADLMTPEERDSLVQRLREIFDGPRPPAVVLGCASPEASWAWLAALPSARRLDLRPGRPEPAPPTDHPAALDDGGSRPPALGARSV